VPKLKVNVTPFADFGFCPVNEVAQQTLSIDNIGEVPAPFQWQFQGPFEFSPSHGVVDAGKSQQVVVRFSPSVCFACASARLLALVVVTCM